RTGAASARPPRPAYDAARARVPQAGGAGGALRGPRIETAALAAGRRSGQAGRCLAERSSRETAAPERPPERPAAEARGSAPEQRAAAEAAGATDVPTSVGPAAATAAAATVTATGRRELR